MRFQGKVYAKEADVRKAIELTLSQVNSGTAGERADAKFGAIITLYRSKFLPSESRLLELKRKLYKVFPADAALVDSFTVAREDEIDEINLMLKAPSTPENIRLLAQRLAVPNAPDLEFSTRQHHAYLLDHYTLSSGMKIWPFRVDFDAATFDSLKVVEYFLSLVPAIWTVEPSRLRPVQHADILAESHSIYASVNESAVSKFVRRLGVPLLHPA
jgi:hypothetical protein